MFKKRKKVWEYETAKEQAEFYYVLLNRVARALAIHIDWKKVNTVCKEILSLKATISQKKEQYQWV